MSRHARPAAVALGVVTAVGVAAFAWGALVERNRFTVRHETLPLLEPGSRPVTVLHLSDLHLAPGQDARTEFVRSLVQYEPDLVIYTGDNLGHLDGNAPVERALEVFRGVTGVFVHSRSQTNSADTRAARLDRYPRSRG